MKSAKQKGVLGFLVLLVLLGAFAQAEAQDRRTVTARIANIRSGPGTNYDVLWQVEKYHPLLILETKGNWYRFRDFEGDKAWLHDSLVGKVDSVITVEEKCNVRSGPGTDNPIVFKVERGVPFKVLNRRGNWLKVEHADGDRGWIYKTLVW
ncbi:MAG: SH3 domain-containing protein [Desulfarculaceae bacterium]|nr:SH3 domain-containing protein [Desulfarculaceae bacterium]